MKALRHGCILLAIAVFACQLGPGDHVGRMALGLTGQFLPGELTMIDIEVYRASDVTCADGRRVEGDTSRGRVDGQTGLTLPIDSVEFTLDAGRYVIGVRAGQDGDLGPGGSPVAEGCATTDLAGEGVSEVTIPLRRQSHCGDGNLDVIEMCDDGNGDPGDGCDGSCRTEARWLITHPLDTVGNQSLPRADGDINLTSVCWSSDHPSNDEAPTLWLDRFANPLWTEVYYQEIASASDCTAMDTVSGAVLMTFMRGENDPRWPVVTMWNASGTALDPMRAVIILDRLDGTGGSHSLHAQLLNVTGVTIGPEGFERPVDDTGGTTDQTDPAVAGGVDGQYIVAWRGSLGRVWARVFDTPGSGGSLLRMYDGSGVCGPPSVARLEGSGPYRYAVVFADGEFGRITGRLITSAGIPGEELQISDEERANQPVVTAHDEEFIVTWAQPGSDGHDVLARVLVGEEDGEPVFGYLARGDALTNEPMMVNPTAAGAQDNPSVAPATGSDEGTAIVVYRDSTGDGDDIAARVIRIARTPSG